MQDDAAFRFSLRQLLAVIAYLALTMAIVSAGAIGLGIQLSLALVGWILWRFAHGHLGGIIPALLGVDVLLLSSMAWIGWGSEDFLGLRGLLNRVASVLVLIGIAVLIGIGVRGQRFSKHQLGVAAVIFCALIAWWIAIPMLGDAAVARRRAADVAANNLACAKAVALVEDFRTRTGTLPEQHGREALLPEPIPSVRWDGHLQQIQYQRTGDTTYQLIYIDGPFMGDIITYDSATPKRGWYRVPF